MWGISAAADARQLKTDWIEGVYLVHKECFRIYGLRASRVGEFLDEASGAWVQLRGLGKQSRRQNEVAWWLGFPESAMPSVSRQFSP